MCVCVCVCMYVPKYSTDLLRRAIKILFPYSFHST